MVLLWAIGNDNPCSFGSIRNKSNPAYRWLDFRGASYMVVLPTRISAVTQRMQAGLITFADWLKSRRATAGITQRELAKRVGISMQAVSFYEQARRMPQGLIYQRLIREIG